MIDLVQASMELAQPLAAEYAEGNMSSRIRVTRASDELEQLDPDTGRVIPPAPTLIYEGPAKLTDTSGPLVFAIGDEPQYFTQLVASVPLRAPRVKINDVVTVLRHADADLVNRAFRATDINSAGALPASRHITLVGTQPAENT